MTLRCAVSVALVCRKAMLVLPWVHIDVPNRIEEWSVGGGER